MRRRREASSLSYVCQNDDGLRSNFSQPSSSQHAFPQGLQSGQQGYVDYNPVFPQTKQSFLFGAPQMIRERPHMGELPLNNNRSMPCRQYLMQVNGVGLSPQCQQTAVFFQGQVTAFEAPLPRRNYPQYMPPTSNVRPQHILQSPHFPINAASSGRHCSSYEPFHNNLKGQTACEKTWECTVF